MEPWGPMPWYGMIFGSIIMIAVLATVVVVVVLIVRWLAGDIQLWDQTGLAAGAVEVGEAQIPVADVVAPAHGEVHVLLLGAGFVDGIVGIDDQAESRPALPPRTPFGGAGIMTRAQVK